MKREEEKGKRADAREIRRRKRSFRVLCLAAVLLLQGGYASLTAFAATYKKTAADACKIPMAQRGYSGQSGVTYLNPGDVISIPGDEFYGSGEVTIDFYDKKEGGSGKTIYYYKVDDAYKDADGNFNITAPKYEELFEIDSVTGTPEIAKGEFREWQVTEIYLSSGKVYGIIFQAIPYTVKHTITYDVDATMGENPSDNPADFWEGKGAVVKDAVAYDGYAFLGWYEQKDTAEYDALLLENTVEKERTTDVVLQARFAGTHIYYQLDGGTNAQENPSTYQAAAGVGSFAAATRDGYTFEGWYDSDAYGTQITSIPAGTTGDVTLWARWSEIDDDDADDGSDNDGNGDAEQSAQLPVKDAVPETGDDGMSAFPVLLVCATAAAGLSVSAARRSRRF